jgi:hypothetical protein
MRLLIFLMLVGHPLKNLNVLKWSINPVAHRELYGNL